VSGGPVARASKLPNVTARRASASIEDVRFIALDQHSAPEGLLTVAEHVKCVPFKVERCFIVKPSAVGTIRGQHAHRRLNQFLICSAGEVHVLVDDSTTQRVHVLRDMTAGLLVPPGIWSTQTYQSPDSTLVVLCDRPFSEADYIRDYDVFSKYVKRRREILNGTGPIRLNLGCGGRPLAGYINVDIDSVDELRARYPGRTFDDALEIVDYDIFNLPLPDASVDEIRAEALIEHLPFADEVRFFDEVMRVLKPGAKLYLTTVDFEQAVRQWLVAKDEWKDFYRNDAEAIRRQHWFGTYSYAPDNRWGYLTATLFGSQNGSGQFHTNCYSEAKLRAICRRLNLEVDGVERFQWQGDRDYMLALSARKGS
jgi:dTDP-4-dehydrorhamnose 3,5-epimerase-like enzyme